MLSLHTNRAAFSAQDALHRSGHALSLSQTRLSTGHRVNSAMDDAAGLQMASRLQAQSSGMAVAMRNTQNSVSMLQTADGLMDSLGSILVRIQDLAIQAADGASTDADRVALHAEYLQLSQEANKIVNETPYNGRPLIRYTVTAPGTLAEGVLTFQTGADAAETMAVDFRPVFGRLNAMLYFAVDNYGAAGLPQDGAGTELTSAASANALLFRLDLALDTVGSVRAQLGATSNRLESVFRNLSNMRTNSVAAQGRILDTDYAIESAEMAKNQMLMQSNTAMLKQSNSLSQTVMSLLQ